MSKLFSIVALEFIIYYNLCFKSETKERKDVCNNRFEF